MTAIQPGASDSLGGTRGRRGRFGTADAQPPFRAAPATRCGTLVTTIRTSRPDSASSPSLVKAHPCWTDRRAGGRSPSLQPVTGAVMHAARFR